jgi:hypothetical protein
MFKKGLPFEYGGTESKTVAQARQNLNYLGRNPVTEETDTTAVWSSFGSSSAYISGYGHIVDQPDENGFIESHVTETGLVSQLWHSQTGTGTIYKRAGSTVDGIWYDKSWTKLFDSEDVIPIENGGTKATTLLEAADTLGFRSFTKAKKITLSEIAEDNDLNQKVSFGNFACVSNSAAAGLKNSPTGKTFRLEVFSHAPGVSGYITQVLHDIGSGTKYSRRSAKGGATWGRWARTFDSNDLLPVEYGGIGADSSVDMGATIHQEMVGRFIAEMNRVAASIGMNDTIFRSPSGLYSNSVNADDAVKDISYNSKSTARDIARLMIAARHAPAVLKIMGTKNIEYVLSGKFKAQGHSMLTTVEWTRWAEENNYTILGAKGGSCKLKGGERGDYSGINNSALILKAKGPDDKEKLLCCVLMGMHNPTDWSPLYTYAAGERVRIEDANKVVTHYRSLISENKGFPPADPKNSDKWEAESLTEGSKIRAILRELISIQLGIMDVSEAVEVTKATNKENRPWNVGMIVVELTDNGSFADDIARLEDETRWTGFNVDEVIPTLSIAKIMTAIIAVANSENHLCTINYDDMVGGSQVDALAQGEVLTTYDAINLMMLESCNVSATLLARDIGRRLPRVDS